MIKKVLIAGLFIGGGYYFIKKLLPKFSGKDYKADVKDFEVKRYISNQTGKAMVLDPRPINTLPYSVLTKAGEGNDSSWDFDPYRDERQDNPKALINGVVLWLKKY